MLFEKWKSFRQKVLPNMTERELGDVEREEYRRDSPRQLRELRSARQAPQTQGGLTPQQRNAVEADTFRAAYRVTREEEAKMEVEWTKFEAKNPAWRGVRPWQKYTRALALVRKARAESPGSMVEGGQHAAASKAGGRGADKARQELGARLMGVDVETYRQTVAKHGRGAR